MNRIFIFIIFTELFSSHPIKPKFCCDCKFFTKHFFSENKFGKCSLFPNKDNSDNFLVDGIRTKPTYKLTYCSIARTYTMCGPEGKFFEQKSI